MSSWSTSSTADTDAASYKKEFNWHDDNWHVDNRHEDNRAGWTTKDEAEDREGSCASWVAAEKRLEPQDSATTAAQKKSKRKAAPWATQTLAPPSKADLLAIWERTCNRDPIIAPPAPDAAPGSRIASGSGGPDDPPQWPIVKRSTLTCNTHAHALKKMLSR